MVQAIEYYLTDKGKKFDAEDPKYLDEEKEIIEFLREGRKNTYLLMNLVNEKLKTNFAWEKINKAIIRLIKEGLIKEFEN